MVMARWEGIRQASNQAISSHSIVDDRTWFHEAEVHRRRRDRENRAAGHRRRQLPGESRLFSIYIKGETGRMEWRQTAVERQT